MINQPRSRDNPRAALGWGLAVTVLVPTFFATVGWPDLRRQGALLWLCVTGLLMGVSAYCRRRARAYLRDEPDTWDKSREWRLLNPDRYEESGRVFVRCQIAMVILVLIWWTGGALTFVFS